jgi:hypothetical protein
VGFFGLVALNPITVAVGLGLAFLGTSAFVWNYVINGEKRAVDRVQMLREIRRQQVVSDFDRLIASCQSAGFPAGAIKAASLCEAYGHLLEYLRQRSGSTVDSFRVFAEDTFKQGFSILKRELDIFNAIKSVEIDQVSGDIQLMNRQLAKLDENSPRAHTIRLQIAEYQRRIDLVTQEKDQLSELLVRSDEIEGALQETLIKLAGMSQSDPSQFLDDDNGAVQRLRTAVEAAKRVEERLRGGSDAETTALMKEYAGADRTGN